jgi:hypothetical protein
MAWRVVAVVERIGDRPSREGRHQALFRGVNERLRDLNERLGAARLPALDWLCECANSECVEQISMTAAEYAGVRANSVHFVVRPGEQHVFLDAETVVLETERFWVVEKFGEAAEAAGADGGRA